MSLTITLSKFFVSFTYYVSISDQRTEWRYGNRFLILELTHKPGEKIDPGVANVDDRALAMWTQQITQQLNAAYHPSMVKVQDVVIMSFQFIKATRKRGR